MFLEILGDSPVECIQLLKCITPPGVVTVLGDMEVSVLIEVEPSASLQRRQLPVRQRAVDLLSARIAAPRKLGFPIESVTAISKALPSVPTMKSNRTQPSMPFACESRG